jgi:hypothetical protein
MYTLMNTNLDDVQKNGYRSNTNTESGMYPPGTEWAPSGSSFYEFSMVANWGIPPTLPFQNWNCTGRDGGVYAASDYTGVVTGKSGEQTLCQVGECCKDWYGLDKWSDDAMSYHEWLNNLASFGLCEDTIEPIYCQLVDNHYRSNCYELRPTPTTRAVSYGCPDAHMNYWLSCSVYKTVEMFHGYKMEPQHYMDSETHEQKMLQEVAFQASDKVCNPYSYYFPDTAVDSTSTSAASEGSDGSASASAASEGSDESASASASPAAYIAAGVGFFMLF